MNVPQENGYTIYTKQDCSFCLKAKRLLDDDKYTYTTIHCDELLSKNRIEFLTFMSNYTDQKSFPFIFHNGEFIGGYTELLHHLTFMD
jgi:glutaredoxin